MRKNWIPKDVRIPFALLLASYVTLGITVLGFNRSLLQIALIVVTTTSLDFVLNWFLRRERNTGFPWSGLITGLGLCLLLNSGHNHWIVVVPATLAIASKHIFRVDGQHVYNPNLFGLISAVILSNHMMSPAPAYQWGGSASMVFFVAGLALTLFAFRIRRNTLVLSFLVFYGIQTVLRAFLMREHLPMETVILGTFSAPAFFLFAFYMMTDPRTSPVGLRSQILWAAAVTVIDFLLHMQKTYTTLFPSLFLLQTGRYLWLLGNAASRNFSQRTMPDFKGYFRPARIAIGALAVFLVFSYLRSPFSAGRFDTPLRFEVVEAGHSGITADMSEVLDTVDERMRHLAKYLISIGDSVAVADADNDGDLDLFLTNTLKQAPQRSLLYLNEDNLRFRPFEIADLRTLRFHPQEHGLASCPVFADYDNDGDQDLFLGVSFGRSRLLRNLLVETGQLRFEDASDLLDGVGHTTCMAALWLDYNQDGWLDLYLTNSLSPYLTKYSSPTPFNPFDLPDPAYEGDRRMLHFLHNSWHLADNGGENFLLENQGGRGFVVKRGRDIGMPETRWTLAVNSADFDRDGLEDIYCASDFGPDDLYLNNGDGSFRRVEGGFFGTIGRDTYKGMNVSVADFDQNGFFDIYVSNSHVPMQAEGSLFWTLDVDRSGSLRIRDRATQMGVLNERRFGWGASAGDVDLDGWTDLAQANGMIGMRPENTEPHGKDYWYSALRMARANAEAYAYADRWADIRGYSIFAHQKNRLYLNQSGSGFVDVAESVGIVHPGEARAAVLADLDNDGDLDLLFSYMHEPLRLYANRILESEPRNWVGFAITGNKSSISRNAFGVEVEIAFLDKDGKRTVRRDYAKCVAGFSGQADPRVHFGLPLEATQVDVQLQWGGDTVYTVSDLPVRSYHSIDLGTPAGILTIH